MNNQCEYRFPLPSWMGEDQDEPCRCDLGKGHTIPHSCHHLRGEATPENVECRTCGDTGVVPQNHPIAARCPDCNGFARNGDGWKCPTCGGDGINPDLLPTVTDCPDCDGTGRTPENMEEPKCPQCGGWGKIGWHPDYGGEHCDACNGTGRTPENVETSSD